MSEYLIKIINRVIGILKILCWKILYGSRFHSGKMTFFYPGCHLMIEKQEALILAIIVFLIVIVQ